MYNLLLGFDSINERQEFINKLEPKILENMVVDPLIREEKDKIVSLFVSGQNIISGTITEINKRFEQEIASHSGGVEIREKCGEKWNTLRRRPRK